MEDKEPYLDPRLVTSPKGRLSNLQVIFDGKSQSDDKGWSLAKMTWDGEDDVMGIRWNGGCENTKGVPLSSGQPVWFILPREFSEILQKNREEATKNLQLLLNTIYN